MGMIKPSLPTLSTFPTYITYLAYLPNLFKTPDNVPGQGDKFLYLPTPLTPPQYGPRPPYDTSLKSPGGSCA
jgi:hypothetical protein